MITKHILRTGKEDWVFEQSKKRFLWGHIMIIWNANKNAR
jgi:hypothetical protein